MTEYSYVRELMYDEQEGGEDDVDPELHTEGLPIEEGWELAIRFPGDGTVVVVKEGGKPDAAHTKLLGRHKLAAMPVLPHEISPRPDF